VIPAVRLDSSRQQALEDGKLALVPIRFVFTGGVPFVTSVAPGTQAARQDVRVGDELLSVDGATPSAQSGDELEIELAGVKGSAARLTFRRRRLDGTVAFLERAVKRELANEASAVALAAMLDSTTGYLRITTFAHPKVADDTRDAIARLERGGMQRLLLDLRDNGGGLVVEAGRIAGEFLPKGVVVYSTRGRKEAINRTERVSRSFWRRERSVPVVVLVNHGTASASELVAGALQDHDRAVIVGRPTFGKALLMQGLPLTDGSLMMLVVGHVQTPCGRVVQRQYRGVRAIDYLRGASADRDTTGRPSCRTAAGRTVYGGGGIYPDVVLETAAPEPAWLSALREGDALGRWASAAAADPRSLPATMDGFLAPDLLDTELLASLRRFAAQQGTTVPDGTDADAVLRRVLPPELARARLGEAAFHRVQLAHDPWLAHALRAFSAAALLRGPQAP
jgi:carboxyl-terminal processing protease